MCKSDRNHEKLYNEWLQSGGEGGGSFLKQCRFCNRHFFGRLCLILHRQLRSGRNQTECSRKAACLQCGVVYKIRENQNHACATEGWCEASFVKNYQNIFV